MHISAMVTTMICMVASVLNAQGNPLVFESGIDVVNLSVSVIDKKGAYVDDLSKERFVVYENGEQQEIVVFEKQELPLRMTIVVDISASMQYSLADARAAAAGFIKSLRPEDQGSITTLSVRVVTLQELTSNHELLEQALLRIPKEKEETHLYDGIISIINDIGKVSPSAEVRNIIILITDGEDVGSNYDAESALHRAVNSGIPFYIIGIPNHIITRNHTREDIEWIGDWLELLSEKTGGLGRIVIGRLDMRQAYRLIQQELQMQYRIGYTPTHRKDPGPDRSVLVQILGGWNHYTVRHRTTYSTARHP